MACCTIKKVVCVYESWPVYQETKRPALQGIKDLYFKDECHKCKKSKWPVNIPIYAKLTWNMTYKNNLTTLVHCIILRIHIA